MGFEIATDDTVSTFRRDGREFIIDITLCDPLLTEDLNWKFNDEYFHSVLGDNL